MYGVEIWGLEERPEIKKVQSAFIKMIMGVFYGKRDEEGKDGKHGSETKAQIHSEN